MNPQTMNIRRAIPEDLPGIDKLLSQVNAVHHEGRPDLFNLGRKWPSVGVSVAVEYYSLMLFYGSADNFV